MKKSVALLIAAVTLVGCVGLFGLYTALDVKAKAKVKKETTMTDSSGMVTREYNLGKFDEIEVEGNIKVEFVQGAHKTMTVTAPQFEMEHLKVEVSGSKLEIEYDKAYYEQTQGKSKKRGNPAVVKLSAPSVRSIEMSLSARLMAGSLRQEGKVDIDVDTSGKVEIQTIDCAELSLSADTSGSIEIGSATATKIKADSDTSGLIRLNKGQASSAVLKADTSGRVRAGVLSAFDLNADADTSGSIEVDDVRGGNVVGRADTSGRLALKGEAASVDFYADTSGSIKAGELKAETATVGSDTGGKVVYCARNTSHKGASTVNTYKTR